MNFLHRDQVKSFHFTRCFFDEAEKTAHLQYAFNDGAVSFEEKIRFNQAPDAIDPKRRRAIDACLRLLHLAAGVSYYKLYIPDEIRTDCTRLTKKEADFFNLFYTAGLGEFSYRNDVSLHIDFPFSETAETEKLSLRLKKKIVVPVGGGKDSVVSIETLKAAGYTPLLFSVGCPRPIKETIAVSGLESVSVTRTLSADLKAFNEKASETGALNGHIPVTGIIAFILMLAAVLYDFSDVAMSNERSANVGNTEKDGRIVNHQWSKSLEFERAFHALTADVLPDFRYFSLLRPLSELAIASLFAGTEKYDSVFTSCNKAFRLDENKRLDRWCADCDKCRFVFLALAPFTDRERLIKIFGKNMLDDASQTKGYEELLGLSAFKPFECVGEIEESALAFLMLIEKDQWKQDVVCRTLKERVLQKYGKKRDSLFQNVFALTENHLIPRDYADVIRRFKEQTSNGLG
ncbi:MAG: endonuclease domain-containing protein [Alphaproteobacteria bacterium]|nr:endonuclease domain-containing protein [Alphaproteobacteria bacterium]